MYRDKLILTYRALLDSHEELMERIINVGMTGPFAEVNEVFEAGDTFRFDLEMFRDSKDQNLQMLLNFFDELENLMNTFANVNGITQEELDDENI